MVTCVGWTGFNLYQSQPQSLVEAHHEPTEDINQDCQARNQESVQRSCVSFLLVLKSITNSVA